MIADTTADGSIPFVVVMPGKPMMQSSAIKTGKLNRDI
jgi:hypothetical protein